MPSVASGEHNPQHKTVQNLCYCNISSFALQHWSCLLVYQSCLEDGWLWVSTTGIYELPMQCNRSDKGSPQSCTRCQRLILNCRRCRAVLLSCADYIFRHTCKLTVLVAPQYLTVSLQAKISCILEARSHADTTAYVHVPFTWLEHGDTLGANASELEHYINLGHRELHSDDLPSEVPVHEKGHCHDWADSSPQLYELLRTELRYKLQSAQLKLNLHGWACTET